MNHTGDFGETKPNKPNFQTREARIQKPATSASSGQALSKVEGVSRAAGYLILDILNDVNLSVVISAQIC